MKLTLVVLIVTTTRGTMGEYCLYGDRPDCAFECHCAVDAECGGSGVCTSGCDQTGIEEEVKRRWTGDTCQIGNIASGKPANQSSTWADNNNAASKATDGRSAVFRDCTSTSRPGLGEWWLDLGDLYKIYNITIYNRKDCCQNRLSYTNVSVMDGNKETWCAAIDSETERSDLVITLTCERSIVGRSVHIARYRDVGNQDNGILTLCEVIVTGHKYINCSKVNCPDGIPCNDVTGCTECIGTYLPYCTTECGDGFYGINCEERCGKCTEDTTCDKMTGCQGCQDGFYGQGCNKQCGWCEDTKCNQADGTCPECQLWWGDSKCMTMIDRPKYINETMEFSATNSSITLKWQSLGSIPDRLVQYYQYTVRYKQGQTSSYTEGPSTPHNGDTELTATISELDHNTEYDIIIVPQRVIRGETDADPNTHYGPVSVKTNCNEPKVSIQINKTAKPPQIKIIIEVDHGCDNISNVFIRYKTESEKDFTTVQLELDNLTHTISPANGSQYDLRVTAINNKGLSSTRAENINLSTHVGDMTVAIVVPIVTVVVIGAAVAVGVIFYKRRQSRNKDEPMNKNTDILGEDDGKDNLSYDDSLGGSIEALNVTTKSMKPPIVKAKPKRKSKFRMSENIYENSAVGIEQFEGYVASRKANADDFLAEYKTLPKDDIPRCQAAQTLDNKPKNRFKNIYPYDDTRVHLHSRTDDYINANYVSGYGGRKCYIATQGPLDATSEDFWQMIWQEDANTIIMVANLVENSKERCCEYWPMEVGQTKQHGDFKVKNESAQRTADYTSALLTLHYNEKTRNVRHFHFTTWVDKNKPLYGATSLLAFYRKVQTFENMQKGPLVVHCSAGVGRTGTFIVLHILLQQVTNERKVDVYGWVKRLRGERMTMVQTMKQYVFTHDVLLEFIKCGDISVPCSEFDSRYRNKEISIRKQFDVLKTITSASNSNRDKDGLMDVNINKNRNKSVIPANSDHPYLPGLQEESYINAVFVDTFKLHELILVTQMPLPHTISDFWRLIHNQRTQIIIMLNHLTNDQASVPYWPKDGSTVVHGGIEVTLTSTSKIRDTVLERDFKITKQTKMGRAPEIHSVKQLHLLSWPEDTILPQNRSDLLELIDIVDRFDLKIKEIHSDNVGAVVVHCLDGVNHSGMFCAMKYMIDKMKLEQEVDPFLAARYVSSRRPEFFQDLAQYDFLYKMAADYMSDENNQYVNAK